MPPGTRVATTAVLLLLTAAAAAAQPLALTRGAAFETVVSKSDPTQRYVLYLPASVAPDKPVPVLFVMDYRGRGRRAAELFRPAAERLGWVVASSYNTASDGAGEPNVAAVRAMWNDLRDSLAIDERRLYLAGLSGTARMATLIARKSGVPFRGVIGAAAGFHPTVEPARDLPFLYFGTAGTTDYNYWEMRLLEQRLAALGVPHRIAFFDGGHGWMPPELADAALAWMELRAMQDGHRAADATFVEARWKRDTARALALERDQPWEASRLLAAMADDYRQVRPDHELADVARRARELGGSSLALAQAKAQERAAKEHDLRVHRALQVIADAFPAAASEPRLTIGATVLDLDVTGLRRAAAGKGEQALAAARVLAELNVQTGFYLPAAALKAGDDERAKFYLGIAEAIDPADPYAWYLRGAVAARVGHVKSAIDALNRALALGFTTVDALEHERAFDALRERPEFAALLDRLRASSDEGLR